MAQKRIAIFFAILKNFRKFLFASMLLLFLVNCGGIDSGSFSYEEKGDGGTGWITIEDPSASSYATESESAYISGEAFISPTHSGCCSGSASDTGVTVTYANADTGISGSASQRAEYCWFFGQRLCGHSWSATVALRMGDNTITVSASDGYNRGRDSIRITRIREATLPAVSSTTPDNNATGVSINTPITALFSEEMNASTINETSFKLVDNTGNLISGSVTYRDKTATFTPDDDLDGFTAFTARITTGVKDVSGNRMAATYVWNFSTGAAPDTTPPTVIQEHPVDGSSCSDKDTPISVNLSEDMDTSTINTSTFIVKDSSGGPVGGKIYIIKLINNNYSAYFIPYSDLSYSERYSATVTGDVKDLSGNKMVADFTWNFSILSSGAGTWQPTSTDNAPLMAYHTAVWTGAEMIVWGGENQGYVNTGGTYDPVADTWQPIPTANAPSARSFHTAVWTGTQMIVWGGRGEEGSNGLNTGARYDPATDTWQPTSTVNAPSPRTDHTAIWTGREMIVWGGNWGGGTNTGGRYDPLTDTWQPVSTVNAPAARYYHTAVWTGTEMIVWGGLTATESQNIGGRYDPVTDTWQPISTVDAPSPRMNHTAVWTGTEMIIWGGQWGLGGMNTGGKYDPVADIWQPTPIECAPIGRVMHFAVWTGSQMIVWGGHDTNKFRIDTGSRYDPLADAWSATEYVGAPTGRSGGTAIWTGSEMIVWGGFDYEVIPNSGDRYHP
jgi:N-acetylneuraminic acid mutarotase